MLAGAFALAFATPAFAVDQYFVALDTSSNQCRVMSIEPDGATMRMVGNASYPTLGDAERAIPTLPECNA
jgi:hypothetical protein